MEKKESRSERMYKNSPKIKKGEDGKVTIDKSSKVNDGTDGIQESESHASEKHIQELEHKHSKERMHMFHKHEEEHMALRHKMMKETAHDKSREEGEEKTGKGLIEKVEGDKKTGDE